MTELQPDLVAHRGTENSWAVERCPPDTADTADTKTFSGDGRDAEGARE